MVKKLKFNNIFNLLKDCGALYIAISNEQKIRLINIILNKIILHWLNKIYFLQILRR